MQIVTKSLMHAVWLFAIIRPTPSSIGVAPPVTEPCPVTGRPAAPNYRAAILCGPALPAKFAGPLPPTDSTALPPRAKISCGRKGSIMSSAQTIILLFFAGFIAMLVVIAVNNAGGSF